jgi:hypothetical protein
MARSVMAIDLGSWNNCIQYFPIRTPSGNSHFSHLYGGGRSHDYTRDTSMWQ